MANVSSVSDIKKAIRNKERVLVATNKKTELILLAASKLPAAAFAAGSTAGVIRAAATNAINAAAGLMALTPPQAWVIIAIAGLVLLIPTLRGDHVRIFVEHGTTRFGVEYGGRDKR